MRRAFAASSAVFVIACGSGDDTNGGASGSDGGAATTSDAGSTNGLDAGTTTLGDGAVVSAYSNAVYADSPVAYWRFEETSGTTLKDEVGNAHPGTSFGGVTLGVDGVGGTKAAGLDGTSGCIAIGDDFRFSGRVPFSAEGWVKVTSYGDEGTRILSTEGFPTGVRSGWNLSASYGNSGYPYFDAWNSDTTDNQWVMGAYSKVTPEDGLLPMNEWAYVVGTYTDTNEVVWVNGVERDSENQTGLAIPDKQGTLSLGCASDGKGQVYLPVHGAIDEIAIYDHVLPDASILAHWHAGSGK